MNENQNSIISHVLMQIKPNTVVNEEIIDQLVNVFSQINPISTDEKQEVIEHLHSKLSVRMDRGAVIKEKNHVSWYYSAKKQFSMNYWDRYRTYLFKEKGFNSNVIDSLDYSTDIFLDLLGNPQTAEFQRRGLVIGDVQSGKTATYIALINKAADAGYRVVILLTGTIEKLRRQTQSRLDEGFVGLDSTAFNRDKDNVYIGVGNIDPSISAWAVTSTSTDFNTSTASRLSGKLSSIQVPVLFVLKKNKSVLEKLETWLKLFNANPSDKKIHLPMLLIDDEADNASVNTKKDDENPTIINACIRKLLKLFIKANYVGFTATPYANIFINPDTTQEMLDDDLFPRDFIYALEAPSNYIGARGIFNDGMYSNMLKENDDCEYCIPQKHIKEYIPSSLPLSLKKAIGSFLISSTIMDLRCLRNKHRTMLINISRFIAVQDQIAKAVDGIIRDFQREIRNYYKLGDTALNYPVFKFLKEVFDEHYSTIPSLEFDWPTIQLAIHDAAAPIVVRTVNGGNAAKNLNYDEHEDDGLRLIAVGGFSLSRGLTLEDLCISYFYRNSKMYDTLMQMGRWFGYRDGYADVCQIWMDETAIEWYSYISIASDELRREVRRMQDENSTPKEFGLSVRSDITSLLVTARNKMRTARDYTMTVCLNGKVVETPYLHFDKKSLHSNFVNTESLINSLLSSGFKFADNKNLAIKNLQILNVPKVRVIEYLNVYRSHYLNMDFKTNELVSFINSYPDNTIDYWDIVIAEGDGTPGIFCGQSIKYIVRRFAIKKESKALQMSGKGSRLGSKNLAKGGLLKSIVDEIEDAEKEYQKQTGDFHDFSQELYFSSGKSRNPLLVVYPVQLKPMSKGEDNKDYEDPEKVAIIENITMPVIGLSIGIPRVNGRKSQSYQYKINLIKYKELLGIDDDYEEVDESVNSEGGSND